MPLQGRWQPSNEMWISRSCHVVKLVTVKQNQTFNQVRKQNCLSQFENCEGREGKYNQSIKQIKLPTNQFTSGLSGCGSSLSSVSRGDGEISAEGKRGRLYTELKTNPCLLESLWGIRRRNGPYCIFMISTGRSVYALFYVPSSNKHHLFSTVQKLKEIKIGSKWPSIYPAPQGSPR